ncbi:MAG: hypothetical protein ACI9OB_000277 [Nonlabens sp.]|jgi:hypothetical protein
MRVRTARVAPSLWSTCATHMSLRPDERSSPQLAQHGVLAEIRVRRWPTPTAVEPLTCTLQGTKTSSVRQDVPPVYEVEPDTLAFTLGPATDRSDAPGV